MRVLDDFSAGARRTSRRSRDDVELLRGDIRDEGLLKRALHGVEVVFHQAAVPSVPRSVAEPLRTNSVNVDGTLLVLEASRRAGVRRVVYAASSSAYGDTPELPKVETMPAEPAALRTRSRSTRERSTAGSTTSSTASRRWRCATSTSSGRARIRRASTRR